MNRKSRNKTFADYDLKMDKYNAVDKSLLHKIQTEAYNDKHNNNENKNNKEKIIQKPGLESAKHEPKIPESPCEKPKKPAPLNYKQQRDIAKGNKKIDARLDLHKLTRDEAFTQVVDFIENCFQNHKRMLLIITGKGQGILQKELILWLENPSINHRIWHHQFSAPKHGHEGARYVYLKKNRNGQA